MKRLIWILPFLLALGCAHSLERPEQVQGMDLEQQLETMIDDYVDQVLSQCIELHGMYQARQSPVDCAYQGDLSAMHLSLPSIVYHNQHYQSIAQLEHHWCAAAQSKTGQTAFWIRHFRRENRRVSSPCFQRKGQDSASR